MLKYAASPETVGVSSAGLNRFLDALAASSLELHSVVLLRHGQIAWEMSVSPYDVRTPHVLFSLSKSFTSAAVGFAVAEGLMAYDERICDILPDKAPDGASALLKAVTIHDLLCMGSGLSAASDGIDPEQPDWAKRVLSFPVEHTPGTHFQYNSMGTFLCSQAVQRRTGMTVLAYLTPRLFAPLGIETPRWDESPQGVSCGGWGLHLSTLDVAKFGQLLLRDGVWGGTRVLPEGWVDMATSRKIDNSGRGAHPDWEQGYGYQFWRCRDGAYRGDGMYGQLCWIEPERDAVLAVTAGPLDLGAEVDLLRGTLLSAIGMPGGDEAEQERLRERTAALTCPVPECGERPPQRVVGRYEDGRGHALEVALEGGVLRLTAEEEGGVQDMRFGPGTLLQGSIRYRGAETGCLAAYGWRDGALETVLRVPDAPFTRHARLRFVGDTLEETVVGAGFEREPETRTYHKVR